MKPTSVGLLVCSVLCGLFTAGHGRGVPPTARHGISLARRAAKSSAPPAAQPREIYVVTDTLETPDAPPLRSALREGNVYPAQSWVLFDGVAGGSTPMRVEIVAPSVNGERKGLALAVTEYNQTAKPLDDKLPAGYKRAITKLDYPTVITNEQIFDLQTPLKSLDPNGDARKSLVGFVWVENAVGHDDPSSSGSDNRLVPHAFADSQELVLTLLAGHFIHGSTAANRGLDKLVAEMRNAQAWARKARLSDVRFAPVAKPRVDYIFHEGPTDSTPRRIQGDARQPARTMFEIQRGADGQVQRIVKATGWQGFLSEPRNRPASQLVPPVSSNPLTDPAGSPKSSQSSGESSKSDPLIAMSSSGTSTSSASTASSDSRVNAVKPPSLVLSRDPRLTANFRTPASEDDLVRYCNITPQVLDNPTIASEMAQSCVKRTNWLCGLSCYPYVVE